MERQALAATAVTERPVEMSHIDHHRILGSREHGRALRIHRPRLVRQVDNPHPRAGSVRALAFEADVARPRARLHAGLLNRREAHRTRDDAEM